MQLLTCLGRCLKASNTECHEKWGCPKSGSKAQLSAQNVVSYHSEYLYRGTGRDTHRCQVSGELKSKKHAGKVGSPRASAGKGMEAGQSWRPGSEIS